MKERGESKGKDRIENKEIMGERKCDKGKRINIFIEGV